VILTALLILPQPVAPATIVVNGQTDDPPGTCDLVEAIENANNDAATNSDCTAGSGADTIELTVDVGLNAPDNSTGGDNGLPSITSDITIQGVDGLRAIARDPAAPEFRILHVAASGTVELDSLALMSGSAAGFPPNGQGGAIWSVGQLNLVNSTVSGNTSEAEGGGILNVGTMALTNSTVSQNSASAWGGGIASDGQATLTDSTVSGNVSTNGNGGGIFTENGTVTLINSTVSGNTAAEEGGGIHNYGGTFTITNSTVSGNSTSLRGGGIFASYTDTVGATTLINSTLSGNSAAGGGGIFSGDYGTPTLLNSIIANSTGGNCYGSISDSGNNLADDATCDTIPSTLTDFDPVLTDNGGPTMTHGLLTGSNAIDAGSVLDCPVTDQRGAARESTCDIGSFEFIACPDLVLSDDTIETTVTEENCQTIVTGPNFAVPGTGNLTLRAGKSVGLGDETSVLTDGQLTIEIDPDLQLIPP
jgi:hypothetical protein